MSTFSTTKYQVSAARLDKAASMTIFEQMRLATDVLNQEAQAIQELANDLPVDFCSAVEQVLNCQGAVIVSGVGKACLLYTSPSPRDQRGSRMPSSA